MQLGGLPRSPSPPASASSSANARSPWWSRRSVDDAMKVIAPRMPRLATSGAVANDRTPSSSISRRCSSSRAICLTISSVISGTSCASPGGRPSRLHRAPPRPAGTAGRATGSTPACRGRRERLRGVSGPLLRDHVDQHLVGKRREQPAGRAAQGRLVPERRAEELTRPGEERHLRICGLGVGAPHAPPRRGVTA